MRRPLLSLLAAAVPTLAALPTKAAGEDAVRATYEVRFLGLRVATARIHGTMENGDYRFALDSDYSALVASGSVTGRAEGSVFGARLQPRAYALSFTGPNAQRSSIAFEGGAARRIAIEPPLGPDWNEGRVRLEPRHQRGVVDPLSGLVLVALRAGMSPSEACRTTVPVFSGISRFDVVLSPLGPRPIRAAMGGGREPDVISCRARFVPIAGHRPANRAVREMEGNTQLRVDFEAQPRGAVRLPRLIEIPTRFGTISVRRTG